MTNNETLNLATVLGPTEPNPARFAANHYNEAAEGHEMRDLVLTASSNMRWYLISRVWEGIKATSRQINWTDFLKMVLT